MNKGMMKGLTNFAIIAAIAIAFASVGIVTSVPAAATSSSMSSTSSSMPGGPEDCEHWQEWNPSEQRCENVCMPNQKWNPTTRSCDTKCEPHEEYLGTVGGLAICHTVCSACEYVTPDMLCLDNCNSPGVCNPASGECGFPCGMCSTPDGYGGCFDHCLESHQMCRGDPPGECVDECPNACYDYTDYPVNECDWQCDSGYMCSDGECVAQCPPNSDMRIDQYGKPYCVTCPACERPSGYSDECNPYCDEETEWCDPNEGFPTEICHTIGMCMPSCEGTCTACIQGECQWVFVDCNNDQNCGACEDPQTCVDCFV